MKKFIATAAVCGISLFGFTGIAGAEAVPGVSTPGNLNPPKPGPGAIAHADQPCDIVTASNPVIQPGSTTGLGTGIFDGGQVYTAFCPTTP